jgi:serine/threonine protein kinase
LDQEKLEVRTIFLVASPTLNLMDKPRTHLLAFEQSIVPNILPIPEQSPPSSLSNPIEIPQSPLRSQQKTSMHKPDEMIADRYRILDVLGQGGVGITYLAEDTKTGCKVALKALSLRSSGDWKQMELFEREARILKQLNHPAIPRYIDYFAVDTSEDQTLYIVQEWADGQSLADLVKQGWRTNEAGVRKIAIQVLEILVYLHSLEPAVIHRDIKPHNLVMSEDGKIALVDFGAVQDTYYNTFMRGSTMVGTYGYMAPEQFRGQAVPATDLFALGTTLLFLLTHRHPADLPHDRLRINFRSHLQVSDAFADWLEKMLEPDTDDRFSSAQTALSALKGQLAIFKGKPIKPIKALVLGTLVISSLAMLNSYKYSLLALLPLGFDSNLQNFQLEVIQTGAVRRGEIDAIKVVSRKWRSNGLLCAAQTKQAAESMLAVGLPLNLPCGGATPLSAMAEQGNKEIVELFLQHKAEVNPDFDRYSLVESPLTAAIKGGNQEIVELLLRHGAHVNLQGRMTLPTSPLKEAINQRHQGLVARLLAEGAEVNPILKEHDYLDTTPLHHAVWKGDEEIVKMLIQHGAKVNVQVGPPEYRETPLDGAVRSERIEIVKLLIQHGANVNAQPVSPMTTQLPSPLNRAVHHGNLEMVDLLLKHGANPNARGYTGHTPIFSAAISHRLDIVERLIDAGAAIDIRDNEGRTLFDYPMLVQHPEIAAAIRKYAKQAQNK